MICCSSSNGSGHAYHRPFEHRAGFLEVDQAIPCGLILNELVTNAVKYAYPPGTSGEIVVELSENQAGVVKLSVADRASDLPAGFDWQNSKSMGLPIVDLLTNQLGGTLQFKPVPAPRSALNFQTKRNGAVAPPNREPRWGRRSACHQNFYIFRVFVGRAFVPACHLSGGA